MRIRSLVIILLLVALTASLTACGGSKLPEAGGLDPLKPGLNVPETTAPAAPESTAAPAAAYVRPQGADSAKTLLEKTMDFLHNDCDYSRIADVHDQRACIAYVLIIALYDTSFATETFTEISWDQAMEKAALIMGDAETLEAKDPDLAQRIRERMRIEDPGEYLDTMISRIREDLKSGDLNEDNPNYEKYTQLLIDFDKGADYILEHYPELFADLREHGVSFSLEDALEQFRSYGRGDQFNQDLKRFHELEAEYHPENAEAGRNGGIFSYDIGSFVEDRDVWGIDMLYYVETEVYYLVDFSVWCGSTGG